MAPNLSSWPTSTLYIHIVYIEELLTSPLNCRYRSWLGHGPSAKFPSTFGGMVFLLLFFQSVLDSLQSLGRSSEGQSFNIL